MPITNPEYVLSNSNGFTFGSSARTVTASGSYAGLGFSGTNISATMATNGIQLSVAAPGGGAAVNLSAGTTSNNLQTIVFADSNGVSFGLNGSTITASASGAGGGGAAIKGSGTYSQNTGTVEFANSNGITFGLSNNGTMTASHNGLTSQSNQAYSGANGSATFQTITFADSNGVSFSTGTQGLYATVKTDYLTSQSNQAYSGANGSATFQTITFANSNGVSFSTGTQGLYATVATNYLTSQSNQALSAGNGSFTFQTASFANSNGVSFSTGTQGIYASHNGITSQTNQTEGYYASGNTTGQSSSSTIDARSITFNGAGNVSVGMSAGSLVISGGTASPSPVIISAGTASASLSSIVFSNSNSVSFGLNGSTITASIAAGGATLSSYEPVPLIGANLSALAQNTLFFNHFALEENVSMNNMCFMMSFVFFTNTNSASVGRTMSYGFYTQGTGTNSSRIESMATSSFAIRASNSSVSCSVTVSQGTNSFTNGAGNSNAFYSVNGVKAASFGMATLLTPGQYWMCFAHSSTSANSNNAAASIYGISSFSGANVLGYLAATSYTASNASQTHPFGGYVYSATSGAWPATIALTQLSQTASDYRPYVQFIA